MAFTNPTTPAPTPVPASRPPRRSFKSYFWWSMAGAVVLIALYTAFLLWWSYSEGERAGVLQKFSRRGWICKTWEGEMAMVTMPGAIPEKFYFSTRSDAVAAQLNGALGKRVGLVYEQHVGIPTSCFGETEYFVSAVKSIE